VAFVAFLMGRVGSGLIVAPPGRLVVLCPGLAACIPFRRMIMQVTETAAEAGMTGSIVGT
jgi:hypothetical protein